MNISSIDFKDTGYFNKLILAYLEDDSPIEHLYKYKPNLASFKQAIEHKQQDNTDRETLVKVLQEQYNGVNTSELVATNITALLDKNTFTVTTAHQPLLFTGPLYFIYKICSAINLSKQLKEVYPDNNFVPVYWIGGEDHDFEEISKAKVYNTQFQWQTEQKGSVGRMLCTDINTLIDELEEVLGDSESSKEIIELFRQCYASTNTLNKATQLLVNELFKNYGLVILNQDDKALKGLFKEVIKDEIVNQNSVDLIKENVAFLGERFKTQATPRDINLFYLKNDLRERIVFENDTYKVNNTSIQFSKEQILEEIENHSDRFSPNVILRPLYQETLLPNLAYIGGGGELSYWLQLKPIFEYYKVNYPMLLLRNSVLIVNKRLTEKVDQLGWSNADLFKPEEDLIKSLVLKEGGVEVQLTDEKAQLENTFNTIEKRVSALDKSLVNSLNAEKQKAIKGLDNIEQKMMRSLKRKNEVQVNQIKGIKSKLFPNNSLQERVDNFIPFYTSLGESKFIMQMVNSCHLFDNQMIITKED